jgi:hypothetical protein
VREHKRDGAHDDQEQLEVVLHFPYKERKEQNQDKNDYENIGHHSKVTVTLRYDNILIKRVGMKLIPALVARPSQSGRIMGNI